MRPYLTLSQVCDSGGSVRAGGVGGDGDGGVSMVRKILRMEAKVSSGSGPEGLALVLPSSPFPCLHLLLPLKQMCQWWVAGWLVMGCWRNPAWQSHSLGAGKPTEVACAEASWGKVLGSYWSQSLTLIWCLVRGRG